MTPTNWTLEGSNSKMELFRWVLCEHNFLDNKNRYAAKFHALKWIQNRALPNGANLSLIFAIFVKVADVWYWCKLQCLLLSLSSTEHYGLTFQIISKYYDVDFVRNDWIIIQYEDLSHSWVGNGYKLFSIEFEIMVMVWRTYFLSHFLSAAAKLVQIL